MSSGNFNVSWVHFCGQVSDLVHCHVRYSFMSNPTSLHLIEAKGLPSLNQEFVLDSIHLPKQDEQQRICRSKQTQLKISISLLSDIMLTVWN